MYQKSNPLFLICETPMHAGSGDNLGVVDLPIQRERHTNYPKIEGSSLKGTIREAFEDVRAGEAQINAAFGPETDNDSKAETQAACLGFTDARILLFPVKSMKGVFAWVTSKQVLDRFETDMKLCDKSFAFSEIPTVKNQEASALDLSSLGIGNKILLEEFAFEAKAVDLKIGDKKFGDWLVDNLGIDKKSYRADKLKSDIVVLSNDDFKDFVSHSTEVITRTKIDNATGTVQTGALFTEEFLPTESIMYSLVLASPEFAEKKNVFKTADDTVDFFDTTLKGNIKNVLQIGGNATIGKGIVSAKFLNSNKGK